MFLTIHSTAAIAITQSITNPMGAFFIGLISHYILDFIPHGDEKFKNYSISEMAKMAIVDHFGILIIVITIFLFKPDFSFTANIIFGVIGALLPDWLTAIHRLSTKSQNLMIKKMRNFITPLQSFHCYIHRLIKYRISFPTGIVLQTIFLIIFWWLI